MPTEKRDIELAILARMDNFRKGMAAMPGITEEAAGKAAARLQGKLATAVAKEFAAAEKAAVTGTDKIGKGINELGKKAAALLGGPFGAIGDVAFEASGRISELGSNIGGVAATIGGLAGASAVGAAALAALAFGTRAVVDRAVEARDRLQELGEPLPPEALENLRDYEAASSELSRAVDLATVALGSELAPALTSVADALTVVAGHTSTVIDVWEALWSVSRNLAPPILAARGALWAYDEAARAVHNLMADPEDWMYPGEALDSLTGAATAARELRQEVEWTRDAYAALGMTEEDAAADQQHRNKLVREGAEELRKQREAEEAARKAAEERRREEADAAREVNDFLREEREFFERLKKEREAAAKAKAAAEEAGAAAEAKLLADRQAAEAAYFDWRAAMVEEQALIAEAQRQAERDALADAVALAGSYYASVASIADTFLGARMDAEAEAAGRERDELDRLRDKRRELREAEKDADSEAQASRLALLRAEVEAKIAAGQEELRDHRARARQMARAQKATALFGIGVDTAAAILKAFALFGPPPSPAGMLAAGNAALAGTAQAVAVGKEKLPSFYGGGLRRDEGLSYQHKGEATLNAAATSALGPQIIDALNAGLSPLAGGGGGDVYLDGRKVGRVMDRGRRGTTTHAGMRSPWR